MNEARGEKKPEEMSNTACFTMFSMIIIFVISVVGYWYFARWLSYQEYIGCMNIGGNISDGHGCTQPQKGNFLQ